VLKRSASFNATTAVIVGAPAKIHRHWLHRHRPRCSNRRPFWRAPKYAAHTSALPLTEGLAPTHQMILDDNALVPPGAPDQMR